MLKHALSFLLALVLAAPAFAQRPRHIVVFGDSLSDSGNAFALLGATNTPPDWSVDPFLIPDRPYARGGLHFSNGPTWVEQFARPLALAGDARPALRSASPGAGNYAVGGARARDDHVSFNLPQQVAQFLNDHGGAAPSDALYIVAIGGNDLRDAVVAFVTVLQGGGTLPQAQAAAGQVISDAVTAIGSNMQFLASRGAQRFLVWRQPNIGLTPALRAAGLTGLGDGLAQGFNSALEANVLSPLAAAGLGILRLDVYAGLNQIVANGAAFGLSNTTAACITPNVAPFTCQHPDEFLFWDGIHPTAAGHAIIAQQASALLGQ
jgi:outer membrane lipase/esterase